MNLSKQESGVKKTGNSEKGSCFEGPNGSIQDNDKRTATRNTKLTRSRNKDTKETALGGDDADLSTQKISSKRSKILKDASDEGEVICDMDGAIHLLDMKVPNRYDHGEGEVLKNDSITKNKPTSKSPNSKKKNVKLKNKASDAEILLPQGILLNSIVGIDLSVEDVGHALQFLEFCEAFGEVNLLSI